MTVDVFAHITVVQNYIIVDLQSLAAHVVPAKVF